MSNKPKNDMLQAVDKINKDQKAAKKTARWQWLINAWNAFINALSDILAFVKFLICFGFAALVIAAGVYAAYKGWKSTYAIGHVGLSVAGAAAISLGFSQLWNTVIKRK